MDTELTEEQRMLGKEMSRFMREKSPSSIVRELMDTTEGYDAEVWQQLCSEIELAGMHIPEEYGGAGLGPVELGIALQEMGRYLYCGPFFASSVMGGYALLAGAIESVKELMLPGIASGSTIATLVIDDLDDPRNVGRQITASKDVLSGTAGIVLDAHLATLFIVLAGTDDGLGLFSVASDAEGISVKPLEVIDPTRKLAQVTFTDVAAERIGHLDDKALIALWDQLCVALAHEMIGGAQSLFDSTIEYMKLRYQFGRPIGSFQALKHRCADLLFELELAKSATYYSAHCLANQEGESYVGSMAKAMASDAYMNVAKTAIQLRGGIGFTWEDDTHLWFKRAKSSEMFLGSPYYHRERMMKDIEEEANA